MAPPDPTKYVAIHKESVHLEHEARRNYPKKWLPFKIKENYKFYKPDEVNKQLKEHANEKKAVNVADEAKAATQGTSSTTQQTVKMEKCRCGREQTGIHLLRCLQKMQSNYNTSNSKQETGNGKREEQTSNLPKTSNAFIGWQTEHANYKMWEHSMKYISPIATMPGPRIGAKPYNVIFIG